MFSWRSVIFEVIHELNEFSTSNVRNHFMFCAIGMSFSVWKDLACSYFIGSLIGSPEDQIRRVFDDNWKIIFIIKTNGGDSNEHPQRTFLWRNKQNYSIIITKHLHLVHCSHIQTRKWNFLPDFNEIGAGLLNWFDLETTVLDCNPDLRQEIHNIQGRFNIITEYLHVLFECVDWVYLTVTPFFLFKNGQTLLLHCFKHSVRCRHVKWL